MNFAIVRYLIGWLMGIESLFLLLPAVAYGVGYLQGPVQRERINTGIKIGVNKKQRKQQREKKAAVSAPA